MDTAQWALLISVLSAAIAGCSLGWNIYRDVVFKARVRVTLGVMSILREGAEPSPPKLYLEATNMGPGKVSLQTICLRQLSWRGRTILSAVMMHDYRSPFGGKLPTTLEVGERAQFMFPFDDQLRLFDGKLNQIGLYDSFGRYHWASRKDFSSAESRWYEKFPRQLTSPRPGPD